MADRGREIESLFMDCRERPASEWEAHLAASGADAAVSAEVLSLLRADTDLVDFLKTQASAPVDTSHQGARDAGHAVNLGEERGEEQDRECIGPYLLQEEIGQGGMGKVVLGVRTDGELEMKAAIKFSHPNASSQITARFLRERQLLADLKHPHIAAILDAGTTADGRAYLIMDYITGSHIDLWCASTQPALTKLLGLFRKVVDAVAFAHQRGVIHRDLKPANLMVTHQGAPVLLDFGIAHLVAEENLLTGVHQRLLTPAYAAPEQIRGASATPAMDIYSLGIILLDLLLGGGPQERHGDPAEMISRLILDGRLLRPMRDARDGAALENHERIETIPEALGHVLRTCLEQDPRHRYQTAAELGVDLDRVLLNLARDQTLQTASPKSFDALFWFAKADLEPVTILAQSLRQAGLQIWFSPWSTDGDPIPDRALIQNLPAARTCLICVGPGASPPWMEDAAVRDALAFQSGETRLLPVLLPGAPFPTRQSDLPVFLQDLYWEPLSDGLEQPTALIQSLRTAALDQAAVHTGVCPFRGLSVFREEDRAWFFGRDALIQRLAHHMEEQRFCAVLGPSGSGKSSVVQAGLIPSLRQTDGQPLLFTPTQNPFLELAHQLQRLLPETWRGEELFTRLTGSEQALHFIAREWCAASDQSRLYLVIDQFEEVFTLAGAHARPFLDCLCFALGQKGGPVAVIITMRSDFMGKCVVCPALNKQVMEHLIQVEPMSRQNLALAIQEPAGLSGLRLEPGLLERILDEVAGAPAALPLLEHMLLELYERRQNDTLTQAAYNAIGGVEGALAGRAEGELDSTVRLWDAVTGEALDLLTHHTHWVEASQWSPDGQRLVTHSYDGTVRLWDRDGNLVANLTQGARVFDMDFTPDGRFLAVAGGESTLSFWDVHPQQNSNALHGSNGRVYQVHFLENNQAVASYSGDEFLRVWDARSGKLIRTVKNETNQSLGYYFNQNRHYGCFIDETGAYRLIDLGTGRKTWPFEGEHVLMAWSIAKDKNGVAILDSMNQVQKWREDWKESRFFQFDLHVNPVDVCLSSDAGLLGIILDDQTLQVFNADTQAQVSVINLGEKKIYKAYIFSPQKVVLAFDEEHTMAWWDLGLEKKIRSVPYKDPYFPKAFAIHGDRLLINTPDNHIQIWDLKNHQLILSFAGHSGEVTFLAFSPDGRRFASGGDDRMVKLWDSATGDQIGLLAGHTDHLTSLSFSPDGSRLASGSFDNVVLLWELDTLKALHRIKEQPQRMRLTQKAYQYFGLRLNGLELKSEPQTWLSAVGGYRFPLENPAVNIRPRDRTLLDWFATAR